MACAKDVFAVANFRERCSCEMCDGHPRVYRSLVLVPQALIDFWAQSLEALPHRKRRGWKGRLIDSRGVASRVRYLPGGSSQGPFHTCFEEYNNLVSQWLPIFPYEAARDSFNSFRLTGALSESVDTAMQNGDFDTLNEMFTARSSGKPRKNRYVPVPTLPGEPVRG